MGAQAKVSEALWDVNDLAAYLKTTPQSVYQRVHARSIPFIKVGALVRFKKSAIDDFLEQCTVPVGKSETFQSPFQSAKARLRSLKTEYTGNSTLTPSNKERG